MLTAARILEVSLATNTNPELLRQRRQEIASFPLPKRTASSALLWFANAHPARAEKSLDRMARLTGHCFLGQGVEFSAYLSDETGEAVKVHRDSANMEDAQRRGLVDRINYDHRLLTRYMSPMTLGQTVTIEEHVLRGGHQTVQVHQDFVHFDRSDTIFVDNQPEVDVASLERVAKKYPGIEDALTDLVEWSGHLLESEGKLPDTNGRANIVAQPTQLAVIDSTLIGPEHPKTQSIIQQQLGSLAESLREVA